jgi:acetoin utilization protein AcuB
MNVSEFMIQPAITVTENTPARDVLRLCLEFDLHHLPVTNGDKLVGMVSGRDVEKQLFMSDDQRLTEDLLKIATKSIMDEHDGEHLQPNWAFDVALNVFLESGKSIIPVVDSDQNLIGVVTAVDFLRIVRSGLLAQ